MKVVLLLIYLAVKTFTYWLRHINISHLKRYGSIVPEGFGEAISSETLSRSSAYTIDSSRHSMLDSIFSSLMMIVFLFCGVIVTYDHAVAGLFSSVIPSAAAFFLGLTWLQSVLGIPLDLYGTFHIEAKYGFNTMTMRLWLVDFLKSQAIGSILLAILISAIFWLISWQPDVWWQLVWALMACFSLFMMYISPFVIEPLFNKFEPITTEGLEEEIRSMLEKAGLSVSRVMQMDASKRSKHSNAYFTGIGKVKRIVLYDNLIKQLTNAEIVAVLAHELGHWKKGHIWKRLVAAEAATFVGAWIAFTGLKWPGLPGLLGLPDSMSLPAKMIVLSFIASLALFPLKPLTAWLSRRHEREADQFAVNIIGDGGSLASALVKMSAENLANLHPHPFYAKFYYSHPPAVERVKWLRKCHPC
ncbi:MAG: M48 family metallopeptidase [Deltaproteobacteria bacterium]